jgi:uncharacterized protein (DUF1778 family)
MWIAGIRVTNDLVVELARRLKQNGSEFTAQALLRAAMRGQSAATLSSYDRRNIVAALDNPPRGLEGLRKALIEERIAPGRPLDNPPPGLEGLRKALIEERIAPGRRPIS